MFAAIYVVVFFSAFAGLHILIEWVLNKVCGPPVAMNEEDYEQGREDLRTSELLRRVHGL